MVSNFHDILNWYKWKILQNTAQICVTASMVTNFRLKHFLYFVICFQMLYANLFIHHHYDFGFFFFYFKCELNCILYTWTESGTRLAVLFFSFRCRPFVVCGRYFTSCGHRLVKSFSHISLLLLYVLELPFLYKESWCHKGINCSLNSNSQHVYWITMICSHETG